MERNTRELSADKAYRECDLSAFGFQTTEDLEPSDEFIGQERAESAIHFGLGMEQRGYNLYLAGPSGVGKTSSIREILSKIAKNKPVPPDWCYVYNFQNPNSPMAISFPTGKGKGFKKDMDDLIESLKNDVPRAFESKEFEEERQRITNEAQRQKKQSVRRASQKGRGAGDTNTIHPNRNCYGSPLSRKAYNSGGL
jgi:hypothetical protein